jgi:hypothetical protein
MKAGFTMTLRAESVDRLAHPLFQAGGGGSIPTSALDLLFHEIQLDEAKRLNGLWHSRFPEVGGGNARVCYAAQHGGIFYAAAIWTNPSSPKLPQLTWMMLKRYAVSDDRPTHLAGRMMGWMIRQITKDFPAVQMLVSYSDPATHEGSIYRATGWINDGETSRETASWGNRDRDRTENTPCKSVVRWLYPIWIGPLTRNGGRA